MNRLAAALLTCLLLAACGAETSPEPVTAATSLPGSEGSGTLPDDATTTSGENEGRESTTDTGENDSADTPMSTFSSREDRPTPTKVPESVPPAQQSTPVVSELPEGVIAGILAHAAEHADVPTEQLSVVRAEEVVWADGSMGCGRPGEVYTQAPVDGYWVVVDHNGTEYDYRANTKGLFILCEGSGLGTPPSGTAPTG